MKERTPYSAQECAAKRARKLQRALAARQRKARQPRAWAHEWKKGQVGYYRAMQGDGPVIRAIVQRVHRDGTVTVQAQWSVENEGQGGCYLGYKYRFDANHLFAVKPL